MALQIWSIIIGIVVFLSVLYFKKSKDPWDNPGMIIIILFSLIIIPTIMMVQTTEGISYYHDEDIKIFEYHKFTSYVVITFDNRLYYFSESYLNSNLSSKSKIKLRRYYNYYNTILSDSLIIEGKEFKNRK